MGDKWKTFAVETLISDNKLLIGDGYRAKNVELGNTGLPFARVATINKGFHFKDADRFPEETLHRVGDKVSKPGDSLFTSKGTVGRTAFVTTDTEKFVYAPQVSYWRVLDRNLIEPRFLYYWMSSREFILQIHGLKAQTDMADFVSLTDQRQMMLSLPSLSTQRRIAHILGTLDDKIENKRRMNATLEAIARAIFKSWFVDFDPVRAKMDGRDTGLPSEVAALFPDSFEESELGKIPRGWEVGTLGDIALNPRRITQPEAMDLDTPYIGLANMPQNSISIFDWDYADGVQSNKYGFLAGEILFGKLRPYFHKVGIAPIDGVSSTDILIVAPQEDCWGGLVQYYFSSVDLVNFATAASTGTKMPRTNWDDLASYTIAKPAGELANWFTEMIANPISQIIRNNIHEAKTLAGLRDTLLPRLMWGEI